jgi:uncharacterized protein YbjT (DUF2867 family)
MTKESFTMTTKSLKVLVYGATGAQAHPVAAALLARGHQPYVLTRSPERAADLAKAGAQIVVGDLGDPASLRAANAGMDAVALLIPAFLANPLDAAAFAQNAIDAAREAGVKLIVWNTSGPMPRERIGNPMYDARLDVIAALVEGGVPHIVIEPHAYMENLLGPWTAPSVATRDVLSYPILAERPMGWLAQDDLGKLIVAALERPELAGSHFQVSGIERPTGNELAAEFSAVLGRPISYYAMTPEEMGAVLNSAFGPGAGDAVADAYRRERDNPNPSLSYVDMKPVLTQLPVEMTTIRQWVERHAGAFTPTS